MPVDFRMLVLHQPPFSVASEALMRRDWEMDTAGPGSSPEATSGLYSSSSVLPL